MAILFYSHSKGPYRSLSNFFESPMVIDGKTYTTVEHFFQASKATREEDHERVRLAASPFDAKKLGRQVALRKDWEQIKCEVMKRALVAKFTQHEDLAWLLTGSGETPLREDSERDFVWGWAKGKGRNLLGQLLEEVRKELRESRRERGSS